MGTNSTGVTRDPEPTMADDEHAHEDRAHRIREVGTTLADTAEALGRAEARFVETVGSLVGEATRTVGDAAGRTSDELLPGTGAMMQVAGQVAARVVEAGSTFTSEMLDAGGALVRDLTDTATDAAALRAERVDAEGATEPPPPTVPGPM